MGIDAHGLYFLQYAIKNQPLGRVLTIGRQHLHLKKDKIKRILAIRALDLSNSFCEELLLKYFNAETVTSIDVSAHDTPTLIHDMNNPIKDKYKRKFDTVLDFGTTEHVYNVKQALQNYTEMLSEGGQILHVLPADNFNGHGFWQFSPELFYSLYSEQNGYAETKIFLADLSDETLWYEATKPINGQRLIISSINPLYLLVRTRLISNYRAQGDIHQSDYLHVWNNFKNSSEIYSNENKNFKKRIGIDKKVAKILQNSPLILRLSKLFYKSYKDISGHRFPSLKKYKINDLLS